MKKLLSIGILLIFVLITAATGFCIEESGAPTENIVTITVNLTETDEAFKNPMKGLRPTKHINSYRFGDYEYASTYKNYIKYTDLEYYEDDSVEKIKNWCDIEWDGIETKNIKVIPRVVIEYPNAPDGGEYWPHGIPHGGNDSVEWYGKILKSRLAAMALKLGEAWDNDPRVAAVELGLWGKWGEHHIFSQRIPPSFQKELGDAFTQAFKNKKVMVRYPETFSKYNFGYYWDSFALPDDAENGRGIIQKKRWMTQMISGEVAYDWGNQSKLGGSPNGTLSSNSNTDYVIDWIRKTHASSLGWIAEYSINGADGNIIQANAARVQKELGYRFVINLVTFSSRTIQGGALKVSFNVSNVGNAPFYYNWPVEVSLLDNNRLPVWKDRLITDITQWLPGESYNITGNFTIPADLANGVYTLAFAVLDPAGNKPSLRFANTNYYKGGRTPIGKIGVGQEPGNQDLGSFDSLKSDNTLSYSLEH